MEITGIIVVGVFVFFVMVLVIKDVLQILGEAVDVLHLLKVVVVNILLVDLCDKHREVYVQEKQYGSEESHLLDKSNFLFAKRPSFQLLKVVKGC